jgi:hypothetical protein
MEFDRFLGVTSGLLLISSDGKGILFPNDLS